MQITKFRWKLGRKNEPFLILINGNKREEIPLFDSDLSLKIGKKRCIGFYAGGKYSPCPDNKELLHGWTCDNCLKMDEFFLCVKCRGIECINERQRESCKENRYYIYLAAFDSLLKIGISYEYRILERLVEQGADFGAKIALVKDGKDVRLMENTVKNSLGIADRISGRQKHNLLFSDPNNSMKKIYDAINRLKEKFDLIDPVIYDLRAYYKIFNVIRQPEMIQVDDNTTLDGNVAAVKGNIIIFSKHDNFYSVNAHDLIGREAEFLK